VASIALLIYHHALEQCDTARRWQPTEASGIAQQACHSSKFLEYGDVLSHFELTTLQDSEPNDLSDGVVEVRWTAAAGGAGLHFAQARPSTPGARHLGPGSYDRPEGPVADDASAPQHVVEADTPRPSRLRPSLMRAAKAAISRLRACSTAGAHSPPSGWRRPQRRRISRRPRARPAVCANALRKLVAISCGAHHHPSRLRGLEQLG